MSGTFIYFHCQPTSACHYPWFYGWNPQPWNISLYWFLSINALTNELLNQHPSPMCCLLNQAFMYLDVRYTVSSHLPALALPLPVVIWIPSMTFAIKHQFPTVPATVLFQTITLLSLPSHQSHCPGNPLWWVYLNSPQTRIWSKLKGLGSRGLSRLFRRIGATLSANYVKSTNFWRFTSHWCLLMQRRSHFLILMDIFDSMKAASSLNRPFRTQ